MSLFGQACADRNENLRNEICKVVGDSKIVGTQSE